MAPTKIIALGCCCQITFDLEKYGMRDESSVFEWYDSPLFNDILTIMNMIATGKEVPLIERSPFKKNIFLADTNIRTDHYTKEALPEIFKRRADRFIEYIKSDIPLLFIRHDRKGISLLELEEFKRIVEGIHPACNYHLLCCVEPNAYVPISCPRVFYHSKPPSSWAHLISQALPGDIPNESDVEPHYKG